MTRLLKSGTAASTNSLDLDLERGFLSTGLWRYSRHPNFFCEQSFWCVFYLYAYVSLGSMHSLPAAVGAVLYVLLFQGSTPLTEWITKGKYPRYVEYQRETSRLIPWFARVTATESVGGASSPAKKGTRRAKKE